MTNKNPTIPSKKKKGKAKTTSLKKEDSEDENPDLEKPKNEGKPKKIKVKPLVKEDTATQQTEDKPEKIKVKPLVKEATPTQKTEDKPEKKEKKEKKQKTSTSTATSSEGTPKTSNLIATDPDSAHLNKEDEMADEFLTEEAQQLLKKEGSIFITRETASFEGYREYPNIGSGMSGSSQPSPEDFQTLASKIKGKIMDIDLREEPHFYLDDKPVCYIAAPEPSAEWYHGRRERVKEIENELFDKLESPVDLREHKPGSYDETDLKDLHAVPYSSKTTEEEACKQAGIIYERLTITDGQRPKDSDVDFMLRLFQKAVRDKLWIHFHCRDGHGRTNTAMVMFDVFCNAKNLSLQQICSNHPTVYLLKLSDAIPQSTVAKKPVTLEDHMYLSWTADRADFLCKFYQFCFLHADELQTKELKMGRYTRFVRHWRAEYVQSKSSANLHVC